MRCYLDFPLWKPSDSSTGGFLLSKWGLNKFEDTVLKYIFHKGFGQLKLYKILPLLSCWWQLDRPSIRHFLAQDRKSNIANLYCGIAISTFGKFQSAMVTSPFFQVVQGSWDHGCIRAVWGIWKLKPPIDQASILSHVRAPFRGCGGGERDTTILQPRLMAYGKNSHFCGWLGAPIWDSSCLPYTRFPFPIHGVGTSHRSTRARSLVQIDGSMMQRDLLCSRSMGSKCQLSRCSNVRANMPKGHRTSPCHNRVEISADVVTWAESNTHSRRTR